MFNELNDLINSQVDNYVKVTKNNDKNKLFEEHKKYVNETYLKHKNDLEKVILHKDKSKEVFKTKIETSISLKYKRENGKDIYNLEIIPKGDDHDVKLLVLRSQWRGTAKTIKEVVTYVLGKSKKDKKQIGAENSKSSVGNAGKPVYNSDKEADTKLNTYYFEPTNADLKFFNDVDKFKW